MPRIAQHPARAPGVMHVGALQRLFFLVLFGESSSYGSIGTVAWGKGCQLAALKSGLKKPKAVDHS